MGRKGEWMNIPYPFPEPEIREAPLARERPARERRAVLPPRPRWRVKVRRWHARFMLAPWRSLACAALVSLALAPFAWLAWRAFR